jgi:hypothetical protein
MEKAERVARVQACRDCYLLILPLAVSAVGNAVQQVVSAKIPRGCFLPGSRDACYLFLKMVSHTA